MLFDGCNYAYKQQMNQNSDICGICQYGGMTIESGLDLNNNGILDGEESNEISYVCNKSASSFSLFNDMDEIDIGNVIAYIIASYMNGLIVWMMAN